MSSSTISNSRSYTSLPNFFTSSNQDHDTCLAGHTIRTCTACAGNPPRYVHSSLLYYTVHFSSLRAPPLLTTHYRGADCTTCNGHGVNLSWCAQCQPHRHGVSAGNAPAGPSGDVNPRPMGGNPFRRPGEGGSGNLGGVGLGGQTAS